jgi:hypothetical protein
LRQCSSECATRARRAAPGPCTDCKKITAKHKTAAGRFCEECAAEKKRVRAINKNHLRRIRTEIDPHDVTPELIRRLRAEASTCPMPGCGVAMIDERWQHTSKELDHILPLSMGGTHTIDNVRIICRLCNIRRPHAGRSYTLTVS